MSLRDYFAAAALQGLLAEGSGPKQPWYHDVPVVRPPGAVHLPVAHIAYMMADAMILEREKP